MSLEGNKWVDDVQVWVVKKKPTLNHKPFFLLYCIPLLNTFSLHAMPHLMLHHELLGMGTSLWVLATAVVGSAGLRTPKIFADALLFCF